MPCLFRWIFFGCLARAGATLFALLAVFLVVEAFDKSRYLGQGMDAGLLIEYMALKIPFMISELAPVILLLAASIYISEMSRHHEIVALRAAGLGVNKLVVPLLSAAILVAMISFAIGEWVTPTTNQRLDAIERVHIHHRKEASQGVQWIKDGDHFFRLKPLGGHQFGMIMLQTGELGQWIKRIDAMRAQYSDGVWQLDDVYISQPSPTGVDLSHEKHLDIPSGTGPDAADPPRPRHMRFIELWRYANELANAGLSSSEYVYTLNRKLSAPGACLVMALLAAALCMSMSSRMGAASLGITAAIGLGLLYYVLGNASSALASTNLLPPAFAAWATTLAFGGMAVFILLRREGY